jgi:hypothetical protein
VLSALKDIFRSEFLNSLVINFVCHPTYVNLTHFVFVLTLLHVFVSVVWLILFKIFILYFLLCNICFIVSYSLLLFVSFMGYVERQLTKCLIAASFCASG